MTSYMVYNPPSPPRAYTGRALPVTSRHARSAPERMPSQFPGDDFRRSVEDPLDDPLVLRRAATIELSSVSAQTVQRFQYDIPDHMLQAWPLVHKVHTQRPEQFPVSPALTVLTRRRTRNSRGVYRSSVLTPGEVEFMVRKCEARRRVSLGQRRAVRSCTELVNNDGRAFVTQDGGCELAAGIGSDSRATNVVSISTIEVTLPVHQDQETQRRAMRHPGVPSCPTEAEVVDDNVIPPQTSLGQQGQCKNTGSQMLRKRPKQSSKVQQFILRQPTTRPDWYEAHGLRTPTVLHKYLSDSFYARTESSSPGGVKMEINTTALLNYIREKKKRPTYIPPPPSSGSGEEQEVNDADYQEVHFDTSGVDGYTPHVAPADGTLPHGLRVVPSREKIAGSKSRAPLHRSASLIMLDRSPTPQSQVRREKSATSVRSARQENATSGNRMARSSLDHVTSVTSAWDRQWVVTGVPSLQIVHQPLLPHVSSKQHHHHHHQPKLPLVAAGDTTLSTPPCTGSEMEDSERGNKRHQQEEVEEVDKQEEEEGGDNLEEAGDSESERHLVERVETTKRITVVLPSSDQSVKAEHAD